MGAPPSRGQESVTLMEARIYFENMKVQSARRCEDAFLAAADQRAYADREDIGVHVRGMARTFALEQENLAASMQRRIDAIDTVLNNLPKE